MPHVGADGGRGALEAGLEVWAYIPWPRQPKRWKDPEDLAACVRVRCAAARDRERMVSANFLPGTYELRNQTIVFESPHPSEPGCEL
jgi:hypothetical protein